MCAAATTASPISGSEVRARTVKLAENSSRLWAEAHIAAALHRHATAWRIRAAERERRLCEREKELQAAVAKLTRAEEAVEGELTCMHCLRLFVQPTTVVRTGKTYCEQCVAPALREEEEEAAAGGGGGSVLERGGAPEEGMVRVRRLETLSGKFSFMKTALEGLTRMTTGMSAR